MSNPGDLNRRLVLEAPVETADGEGGVTRSYATAATVWASLTPTGDRGGVLGDGLGASVTHRIVIRAGVDVSTQHRFRLGARIFDVVAVRDSGDGRFLDVHVEERMD